MARLGTRSFGSWSAVALLAVGAVACDALFGDPIQCSTDADCAQLGGTCSAEGLCAASGAPPTSTQPQSGATSSSAPLSRASITVSPATVSLAPGAQQQFFAVVTDDSGSVVVPAPTIEWTVSGGGTMSQAGVLVAGDTVGGPFVVTARSGALSATSSVTVTSEAPVTTGSKYAAAVSADKPVTYLRLGEASGTVASDEMKTANGTYTATAGGLTYGAKGALVGDTNSAMTFNGPGGIGMPAGSDFGGLAAFSVELWFRSAANNTPIGFVVDHQTFGPRQGWNLRVGDAINFERWTSDSTASVAGVAAPAAGSWHHVVAVFDGTRQLLYVDGTVAAQADSALMLPQRQTTYSVGRQNCTGCGDGNSFHGDLDELAIYDKALSAAAVAAHYAAGTK